MPDILKNQAVSIMSYILASTEMRYIEIGEREIFLREEPEIGLVFRADIPGCRPECSIDLNQILLEYAMGCEGCGEQATALKEVLRFGEQLGVALAEKIKQEYEMYSPQEKIMAGFVTVLNSMTANYVYESKENVLKFSLEQCPLHAFAAKNSLQNHLEMAYASFFALCKSLIQELAPDWELYPLDENELNISELQILMRHA